MANKKIPKGLGDGSIDTDNFIRNEIITRFGNPILNQLEDSNWAKFNKSELIITTDSFIVDPIFFPNSNIGELAISGTVNDILASGGKPIYLTFSLIISEDFPMDLLRKILDSAMKTAKIADISIVAGDTKTLYINNPMPSIFINTTGIGEPVLNSSLSFSVNNAKIGDQIILTGQVGNHGLAVISTREGLGFENRIFSDCAPLTKLIIPLLKTFHSNIHCMRDPTRGGLSGALVDIALNSSVDIHIFYDSIPIQKEVGFGCEMLGLDPLELVNEGKMVIVTTSEASKDVLSFLRQHALGKSSQIIGEVKKAVYESGQVILERNSQRKVLKKRLRRALPRLC